MYKNGKSCNVWLPNPYYHSKPNCYAKWNITREFRVPCGKCPSCLAMKQQIMTDLGNYEWTRNCKGVASFVTLTYDDEHLSELTTLDKDGNPVLSLRYEHADLFNKRFRRYLDYHNLWDDEVCKRNYKVMMCGEYGDQFKRPHFHYIFFGIHSNILNSVLPKVWTNGFVKTLPLKDGGIRYVTKYMQKQTSTKANIMLYDDNNLERPFFHHSAKIGQGLFDLENVAKNNFRYKVGNREVPLPYYYRTKYFRNCVIKDSEVEKALEEKMHFFGVKPLDQPMNPRFKRHRMYSQEQRTEFLNEQKFIKNEQLVVKMRQSGETYYEDLPESDKMLDKNRKDFTEKELTRLLTDVNL